MTFDLDVVHSTEAANVERLLAVLRQLLIADFGPLDLLGSIGRNRSYHDLAQHAEEFEVEAGLRVLVLDLATQVAVKEEVAGEKDLAALPVLRRTLAEKQRK